MATRHISPQSFDDILSELGDDPAIPDPHGIHKSNTPKEATHPGSHRQKNSPLSNLDLPLISKHLWIFLAFIGFTLVLITLIFLGFESVKTDSRLVLEGTQNQLTELKKEFAQYRHDVETTQDELYQVIDELEVSIHSKLSTTPQTKISSPPKVDSQELELRRWRYLGMTQVGGVQQAFFISSKARFTLQLGNPALGDWRLAEIQKDQATITNSKGKSLTLKASKIE